MLLTGALTAWFTLSGSTLHACLRLQSACMPLLFDCVSAQDSFPYICELAVLVCVIVCNDADCHPCMQMLL